MVDIGEMIYDNGLLPSFHPQTNAAKAGRNREILQKNVSIRGRTLYKGS